MAFNSLDDVAATSRKAGVTLPEERDTPHPRYITELLTGILRGVGRIADVQRITKRIADEVRWHKSLLPWRRSPLWLVVRVAIQTTLHLQHADDEALHHEYKSFMTFFLSKILRLGIDLALPNDLLHTMHAKLAGRMFKLNGSIHPSLYNALVAVGRAANDLRSRRWEAVQAENAVSTEWKPESLDILADTKLALKYSRGYLDSVFLSNEHNPEPTSFHPNEPPRILSPSQQSKDFSTGAAALKASLLADKFAALHDFEESVSLFLHNWTTQRLRVFPTAANFDSLADYFAIYHGTAAETYQGNVQDQSIMLLTLFEIWMAVDRLATSSFPLLCDYLPEVTATLLEPLLLRFSTSLQRAARIMQYCRNRTQQAKYGSVYFNSVNETSIGVRYFHETPLLKELKSKIEQDANQERDTLRLKLRQLTQMRQDLCDKAGTCEGLGLRP